MAHPLWNILIIVVGLTIVVPARSGWRRVGSGGEGHVRREGDWERELLEMVPTGGMYPSGHHGDFDEFHQEETVGSDGSHHQFGQIMINDTGFGPMDVLPFQENVPHPLIHSSVTAYSDDYFPSAGDSEEMELRAASRIFGALPSGNAEMDYPDAVDYSAPGGYYPHGDGYFATGSTGPEMSHDPLVDSLTHFLGSPEENWEMGQHQTGKEADFEDIWALDTVRQMGKEAHVPQYLVDSVDPKADEKLLELMVRIAENPVKWRSIHSAIQKLDEAVSRSSGNSDSSEAKEIEKRSSPYEDHLHSRRKEESRLKKKKLAKMKKKRRKKHFSTNGWDGDVTSEERDEESTGSHKWVHSDEVGRGRSTDLHGAGQRLRHSSSGRKSGEPEVGNRGDVTSAAPETDGEANRDGVKPKSAAYASIVFSNNENKNFERWKVNYQPVQPGDLEGGVPKDYKHPQWPMRSGSDYNRYTKKKLKMKAMTKNKVQDKEKASKTAADLRRWQLLKFRQHLLDKWAKAKEPNSGGDSKEGKSDGDGLTDKEKSLATNNWVTPKDQKENWPHFAYHRVTSSPSVQQRDAGAQPRHRSAYVAVSVVPTNSSASTASGSNLQLKHEKIQQLSAGIQTNNEDIHLPDFFYQLLDQPVTDEKKVESLKSFEEKFDMGDGEKVRLQRVMRDAEASN